MSDEEKLTEILKKAVAQLCMVAKFRGDFTLEVESVDNIKYVIRVEQVKK